MVRYLRLFWTILFFRPGIRSSDLIDVKFQLHSDLCAFDTFDIRVYAGFLDVIIGYFLSPVLYFTIFIFAKLVANFFEIFHSENVPF